MSSQKRKRSSSVISSTSRASHASSSSSSSHRHHSLPRDAINPLSHTQSTIKQLRVAGLTDADHLPSSSVPDFPHRPLPGSRSRSQHEQTQDSDHDHEHGDDDDDHAGSEHHSQSRDRRARLMREAPDAQIGVLKAVVQRSLEEGDIARARRAFGLLRRSEVRGRPVDLRRGGLWALGAEVLMREGEGPRAQQQQQQREEGRDGVNQDAAGQETTSGGSSRVVRRWGSAANMPRVREYLEALIRTYPYNRLHPSSVSDLDFYPVLFGCEFYDTWAEHRLALDRLQEDAEAWSDHVDDYAQDDDESVAEEGEQLRVTGRERRLRVEVAELASRAMSTMRGIATRMDALLENPPYGRSADMLRLRGMVALYIGDLGVPPSPRTAEGEEEEGMRMRRNERDRARALFVKMKESGGRVDALTEKWLDGTRDEDYGTDEDDDLDGAWSGLPVFSSLPMR